MSTPEINKHNVGRIAERIVANELEFRGFRVSDLNKEGTSANSDLLAAKDGKTLQIQVKGATESPEDNGPWINYGHCNEAIIVDRKQPMFNRCSGFYKADIVVLMSVKSPSEYSCVVLPWDKAEEAARINLDREYRTPRKMASPRNQARCGLTSRSMDGFQRYRTLEGWSCTWPNRPSWKVTRIVGTFWTNKFLPEPAVELCYGLNSLPHTSCAIAASQFFPDFAGIG